jgi:hypothetical protein
LKAREIILKRWMEARLWWEILECQDNEHGVVSKALESGRDRMRSVF